jgi:hypothetical protein
VVMKDGRIIRDEAVKNRRRAADDLEAIDAASHAALVGEAA